MYLHSADRLAESQTDALKVPEPPAPKAHPFLFTADLASKSRQAALHAQGEGEGPLLAGGLLDWTLDQLENLSQL